MTIMERLTTEYVPLEDRIKLTGQISSERIVVLWLTQRMLGMLLPHLFEWLQQKNSKSGKDLLQRMNDEQLEIVGPVIDPQFWLRRFKALPADVELVKDIIKEAKIL